ncbi:MAG: NADH-quinone oxidoreductase subunit L [Geminicoccaceae bacterium]|nr:NADH-quinone oxidoreductase subunit L [Geminicoccaceae bacterium]
MSLDLLPLAAPLLPALTGLAGLLRPGPRPHPIPLLAEAAAAAAFLVAIASAALLAWRGPATLGFGEGPLLLAVGRDLLSVTMLLLVSFVGWVVIRYARVQLDGEAREGAFAGWMSLTLACVLLLVQAGSLLVLFAAWVAIGAGLGRLLLFYPERPQARRAARQARLVARIANAALALALLLLAWSFGTGAIEAIAARARTGEVPQAALLAAGLLAVAALVRTAQLPFHGWIVRVMEAPTPVSAFLHAGIVNIGGFLLLRFADLLVLAPGALAALVLAGGLTALLASLVMLTQPAIKTALAWSTIAQMGFMMLECGLGLWPLALLHLIAHSLYKAHAFLSAGSAVELVAAQRRPGPVAVPGVRAVAVAAGAALFVYLALLPLQLLLDKPIQAVVLGGVLVLGVAYLLAQGLADRAPAALARRTALASLLAVLGYLGFQSLASWLAAGLLPPPPAPTTLDAALVALVILSFALVALAQATLPRWAHHPAAAGLRVHLANGLYLDALVDRLIGDRRASQPAAPSAPVLP